MANLKEIRIRIASVKSTRKITSAMKMVAAAKLRKSQDKIVRMRPYANKLDDIILSLQQSLEGEIEHPLTQDREPNKVLIVVFTSNRGLCGAFNSNAVKLALNLAHTKYQKQLDKGELSFFSVGKKGAEQLSVRGYKIERENHELLEGKGFEEISEFASELMNYFVEEKFDRIEFVYNQFKNAVVQKLISENFLPLKLENDDSVKKKFVDYIYEPNPSSLIINLVPKSLKIKVFKSILDSIASEHGARMTAMHQATDNANDLIQELTLHYNKARQAAITKEILDIVGGAEALK
ncbi:MAG: ATP synthase F1 subunit gamma [Bacteroidota bacterium]|nr:ATP synthase F1 subunit gamma [Bacteroidota bacterium]